MNVHCAWFRLAGLVLLMLPVGAALEAWAAPAPAAQADVLTFEPLACPEDTFPEDLDVECGFISVPENRSNPNSPLIQVAAAIVHAPAARPRHDPLVFLNGGPSFGAIASFAMDAYFAGATYIEDRDVILVDTRGTGRSVPRLGCPEFDQAQEAAFYTTTPVETYRAEMTAAMRACRERLTANGIDLSAYNSAESAADLDDLRRALGYRQWNLIALSADGLLGTTYMRLYPAGIRSAIIDSGISAQHRGHIDMLRGLNELLEKIFAGCAANAACEARYPNLRASFLATVQELNATPLEIPIADIAGGPIVISVDGSTLYHDTVWAIYPDNLPDLLASIWRDSHGGVVEGYIEWVSGPQSFDTDSFLAQGKTQSYMCHDVYNFLTPGDFRFGARELPLLATIMNPENDWFYFDSPEGCALWDVGRAERNQPHPVVSRIPTLLLAGEYDSVIPPLLVRQAGSGLTRSFYYELPAAGHIQLANFNPVSECARSLAAQFLAAPHRAPNASCVDELPRLDFTPPEWEE